MEKEQTIIKLLIELDNILKLENKEDAVSAIYSAYPPDPEEDAIRVKYARSICRARNLLGLSVEFKQGALFEAEQTSEFNSLLQKANQESPVIKTQSTFNH